MAAGDLLNGDNQYELNGTVIGQGDVRLGDSGCEGWEAESVGANDADLDLGDGGVAGFDARRPKEVTVPFVIDCDDETEARTTLAVLTAAWKAGGYVDVELHRQVAGIHEYLTGRARGIQPVMSFVADGVIPGICTFQGLDPEIMVASS